MDKPHVAVLMGGVSSEHEVSMNSGRMVCQHLNPDQFRVTPVVIDRDGHWAFAGDAPLPLHQAVTQLIDRAVDCVFPVLHGPYGEDGRLQGLLDLLGLPYVGSGCRASAIAIDKIRAKAVVRELDVRLPKHIVVHRSLWDRDPDILISQVEQKLGFSCVIKSPCQGSSLGMAIVPAASDFAEEIEAVFQFGDTVMIEEYLAGFEVTSSVLDVDPHRGATALPLTQILPISSSYFDYEAKYEPGATEEITPAEISNELTAKVQEIAVRVHQVIGCRTWSRSDFIIVANEPVWLEVNTIPGMTQTSLYPQAAQAAGIDYPELLARFVRAALQQSG